MSSNEEEQPTSSPLNVKFDVVPETLEPSYKEHFPVFVNGLVQGEPGGFVFHPHYAQNANKIYNMKVRSDDVWIRTFPRSGTTWTSELTWLIMNDCNFEEAARVGQPIRSPNLDANYINHWDKFAAEGSFDTMDIITIDEIEKMPSPRVLKCHLPFDLLPPNLLDTAKVIYVARNPKDAIVSLFYFHKLVNLCTFTGDLETFVDYFLDNKVLWTPYFGTVLDAWGKRSHPNLLILFYEDMKKDIRAQIKRISTFLNKPVTPEQIEKLVDHVRFDKFSKNESVNYTKEIKAGVGKDDPNNTFVRKGQTGGWKNHFSPEVNRKIDEWIAKNLEGTGLKFVTELNDQ
ncbi:sulfotransferase 1B1-like isoform X3 [Daphnia pulex]|uniref:sulfotransferase 1B1-like isoform X3 n=1 Tax=Daphnia pulex TaxID=6669 RepID=UPI001EDD8AD0|nr:sulfotransferase 1B1-like isoform X3 [Daphnia pulex]